MMGERLAESSEIPAAIAARAAVYHAEQHETYQEAVTCWDTVRDGYATPTWLLTRYEQDGQTYSAILKFTYTPSSGYVGCYDWISDKREREELILQMWRDNLAQVAQMWQDTEE